MSIWFLAICVAAFVVPYALVAFAIKQEESDNDQFNIWLCSRRLYHLNLIHGEKLMSLFNKLIPIISDSFLTKSLPSDFGDLECYDLYDFIEEHVEEDFEHMLPESIFELIENIASNIHYKIRSAK